ncbi:hypothetical protein V865_007679 [Kwoniella europaea PYCC6329]|uniref:Uncharacterized protein n=1 Tax=Kwoniella europaea PYCC6329 TaxID=1423913 RepID=A0AAX4KTM2_9TREE
MVLTSELVRVLVPTLLQHDSTLLSSLIDLHNRSVYQEVVKYLYSTVDIVLPADLSLSPLLVSPRVNAVLRNGKLGQVTKTIRFRHSSSSKKDVPSIQTRYLTDTDDEKRTAVWTLAADIIQRCPNVRTLEWETDFGIGGSLWDAISSLNDLTQLSMRHSPLHPSQDPNKNSTAHFPRIAPRLQLLIPPGLSLQPQVKAEGTDTPLTRGSVVGNGGWGLGIGWENLEVLKIGPLSETGAKTIANHLTLLSMRPCALAGIALETHFLDILLCNAISRIGSLGTLVHVELSTTGMRLTAECLNTIITGCVVLESLKLSGVDGHLSKDTWSTITEWPSSFGSLEIVVAEYSKKFSWILDHLESIHHVPIPQLKHLAIRRSIHPTNLLPFPPPNALTYPPCRPDMALQAIPDTLFNAIVDKGKQLRSLCLNWWEITQGEFTTVMSNCTELKTLEIALAAPLTQVLNLPTSFAKLPMERLYITSDPAVYPANITGKLKIDYIEIPEGFPTVLRNQILEHDPNLPDPRDLKKISRRLPNLTTLAWGGKGGRGEWHFTRKSAPSSTVNIDFKHSAVKTKDIWQRCQEAPPPLYGDVIEIPSSGVSLEIPSLPSTPAIIDSPISRVSTVNTDTLVKTPSTRRVSLAEVEASLEDPSPFDAEAVLEVPSTATQIFTGIPKILRNSKASRPIPATSPSSNPNKIGPSATFSSPRTSQPVGSGARSPPSSPHSFHRRGSSRSWHGVTRKNAIPEQELTNAPRIVPGSGGRQSLPVEAIGERLKKVVPKEEKPKEKVEKKKIEASPKSAESGWTIVGAGNDKPIKGDKSKKGISKKSKD